MCSWMVGSCFEWASLWQSIFLVLLCSPLFQLKQLHWTHWGWTALLFAEKCDLSTAGRLNSQHPLSLPPWTGLSFLPQPSCVVPVWTPNPPSFRRPQIKPSTSSLGYLLHAFWRILLALCGVNQLLIFHIASRAFLLPVLVSVLKPTCWEVEKLWVWNLMPTNLSNPVTWCSRGRNSDTEEDNLRTRRDSRRRCAPSAFHSFWQVFVTSKVGKPRQAQILIFLSLTLEGHLFSLEKKGPTCLKLNRRSFSGRRAQIPVSVTWITTLDTPSIVCVTTQVSLNLAIQFATWKNRGNNTLLWI